MRILYLLHNYPPVHNAGAETMAHAINRWLAARGHTVEVLARHTGQDHEGIKVTRRGSARWADRLAARFDVLLTHLDETPIAEAISRRTGRPLVHVLHNDRQLGFHGVSRLDLIVANTAWVADLIPARYAKVPRLVLHPPTLDVAQLPHQSPDRQALTLVNPLDLKGAPLVYRLAHRLTERPFLIVTGAYGAQLPPPPLDNLTVRPNRASMARVWQRTRILLAPSRYESFGKAAVEALAHGIPVIAHPTPGLLESLGPAGIFIDRDDDDAWAAAIADLDKPRNYAAASKAARARALDLEAVTRTQLETFEAALEDLAR